MNDGKYFDDDVDPGRTEESIVEKMMEEMKI